MNDNLVLAILATLAALLWIVSILLSRSTKRLRSRSAQLDRELADIMEQTRILKDLHEWQQLERLDMVFKLGWHYGRSGAPLAESRRASTVAEIVEGGKRRLLKPVKTS